MYNLARSLAPQKILSETLYIYVSSHAKETIAIATVI